MKRINLTNYPVTSRTLKDIYDVTIVDIPNEFAPIGVGFPKRGDWFLNSTSLKPCETLSDLIPYERLLLKKVGPSRCGCVIEDWRDVGLPGEICPVCGGYF